VHENPSISLQSKKKKYKFLVRTLLAYPLIFLGLYIFPTINRIQDWVDPDYDIFILWLLHSITAPALGFANSIAYVVGLDPEVKYKLSKILPCMSGATPTELDDEEVSDSDFDIASDDTKSE